MKSTSGSFSALIFSDRAMAVVFTEGTAHPQTMASFFVGVDFCLQGREFAVDVAEREWQEGGFAGGGNLDKTNSHNE